MVYSADQGFYLGEHGWFDKRWIFEESLRAPLLMCWPGMIRGGGVNTALVSNIDFAPTFLEAAGLPIPAEIQGKSLVPLLKGQTPPDWRSSFYYQYFEYPQPHHVRPHYGVVTRRYKLVHFDDSDLDEWELFDLEKDPSELRSVYGDPAYASVVADLKRELTACARAEGTGASAERSLWSISALMQLPTASPSLLTQFANARPGLTMQAHRACSKACKPLPGFTTSK